MQLKPESCAMQDYLACTEIMDFAHPAVAQKASELARRSADRRAYIQHAYTFVRDAIHHSCDIESTTLTCTASQVLHAGEGLCYAKSHLLAALLRHNGIPAGLCYQTLRVSDSPEPRFVLHGLTAVWLEDARRWLRLDARGNKPGIHAQFAPPQEQLAYVIRPEAGEKEFATVFTAPDANVVHALTAYTTLHAAWPHLPWQLQRGGE